MISRRLWNRLVETLLVVGIIAAIAGIVFFIALAVHAARADAAPAEATPFATAPANAGGDA